MSDSDFTPINVARPDGEIDPFLGRPKHLQLDASNPEDAATLAGLASLGYERDDWSWSRVGEIVDE